MPTQMYICPTCGSEVEVGGTCPGCPPKARRKRKRAEAGRRKGWEQESIHDGLGIPEDEFDYEEFVEREFGRT